MSSLASTALEWVGHLRGASRMLGNLPYVTGRTPSSPATWMERWAKRTPNAPALAFESDRFTWWEMNAHSNRYADFLAKEGIAAGDVVALDMDNRPDFLFALHGASKLGAVIALINTNLSGSSLSHAIRVAGCRKVLAGSEHADKVRDAMGEVEGLSSEKDLWIHQDRDGEDSTAGRIINSDIDECADTNCEEQHSPGVDETFCYIYTSGTTGLPKAAIISNSRMIVANLGFGTLMHRCREGDVIYITLPLYHSSAMLLGWGAAMVTGSSIALRRKFSASSFWVDARDFGATSFIYIGELCRYLLNTKPHEAERQHKLQVGVGNGMRPDIWEPFQERFNVPVIREFYGATEGNTAIMNFEGKPGMIGRMMPGQLLLRCDAESGEVERGPDGLCRLAERGEPGLLVGRIAGSTKFDGYVDPEATKKKILSDVVKTGDRYFNSGDLLCAHPGSWLSFVDRVGDTFRWKGENVSTNEVAEALNAAAGVLESNVYGVVVPGADGRAGMAALTVDDGFDLEAFASGVVAELPNYQRPLFLRLLIQEMQVTGTFKHQKVSYRKQGFDPAQVEDPLYVLKGGTYLPIDAETYARIEAGDLVPG